jgi:hypothetical protein
VRAGRGWAVVASGSLAVAAIGCGEGAIDLLPRGAGASADSRAGAGADSGAGAACASTGPDKPGAMGPAPKPPKAMTPPAPPCADAGRCAPMAMPGCVPDLDASLLDGPPVTP